MALILALLRLPARDTHGQVLDTRRAVGLVGHAVGQIALVVPPREVAPGVGAARLLTRQGGVADRLGHVEYEAQLERGEELSVEDTTVVVEVQVLVALAQLR